MLSDIDDTVKYAICIDDSMPPYIEKEVQLLTKGKIYEVYKTVRLSAQEQRYQIIDDAGTYRFYFSRRFEDISSEEFLKIQLRKDYV